MVSNKIGCVIAYRKGHTNYGTSLVGYALLKKLQQMGYAVEVINYIKRPTIMQKVSWVVNALRCGDAKDVLSRFTKKEDRLITKHTTQVLQNVPKLWKHTKRRS